MVSEIKLRSGAYMIKVQTWEKDGRIYFKFPYDAQLMADIKAMQGPKYHGFDKKNPMKAWSVIDSHRNRWWIAYMKGENPFAKYERPLLKIDPVRNCLWKHQVDLLRFWLTNECVAVGAEMATGKTLFSIEGIERIMADDPTIRSSDVWYFGTVGSLRSVQLEFLDWSSSVRPVFMTYDRLRTMIGDPDNPEITVPPRICVFDESSRLKNPNSGRSKAAMALTNLMRAKLEKPWILAMSGSPAPKSPIDWWHQCELVCPGYLKESDTGSMMRRLAYIETAMTKQGQVFPSQKAWKDSENICSHEYKVVIGVEEDDEGNEKDIIGTRYCCAPKNDVVHVDARSNNHHEFKVGVNEIAKLHRRMKGLVEIRFKKDCISLPEKQHRIYQLKPPSSMIRAAKLIAETSPRVVTTLAKLRELSDGFQYTDADTGEKKTCPACNGTGVETGSDENGASISVDCTVCNGALEVSIKTRATDYVTTPKDELLEERLAENEEHGRFVVCSAFRGSLDKIVKLCCSKGWHTIKADGKGWVTYNPDGSRAEWDIQTALRMFSRSVHGPEKMAFTGHPKTMGLGLNLQAAQELLWYSLPFDAEDFIQATDRIHRPGMGDSCTISYAFLLGVDKIVYDNLNNKQDMQSLTMGQIREAIDPEIVRK